MVRNSLAAWAPYSFRGRLTKMVLERALRLPGLVRPLARKAGPLPSLLISLLPSIRQALERDNLAFSIAPGTPGRYRKLTVQLMDSGGEILGYLKLACTLEAGGRVRHEARIVTSLCNHLPNEIPAVLMFSEECGVPALVLSAAIGDRGPTRLSSPHREFLRRLHGIGQRYEPGEVMIARLRDQKVLLQSFDDQLWGNAMRWAEERLRGTRLPVGWGHGDFAPWNTRLEAGRLFVFDWERGSQNFPQPWDAIHFVTQVAALLGRTWFLDEARRVHPDLPDEVWKGLVVLYLVWSATELEREESPQLARGMGFRRRALRRLMR